MIKHKVNVISLGCSKNLVDTERMMKMLSDAGVSVEHYPELADDAEAVVVNTCGFIGDAKEESINTILECVNLKQQGKIKKIYVMGCLSERYRKELPAELPEVDRWFGKTDWPALVEEFSATHPATAKYDRIITTPRSHAYIKIAEGCNRFCSFCAIPLITGRYRSRSIEDIVAEMKQLVGRGVREFNVIAQELTAYGTDLYGHPAIAELVDAMAAVEGVKWIRLHYAYPAQFPMELLDAMSRNANVCRYLDIALQHIADPVLTNMRRHITGEETRELLARIRQAVPGIHIRTTLMVGFPGEGEKEFEELLDFVREQRFERMGAFAYCEEEDTFGAKNFEDNIPEEVKQERLDQLMAVQEQIALELNEQKVGRELEVVIDREEPDYYIGRTEFDSPEVDPEVLIDKTIPMKQGEFYKVKITGAMPFELMATPIN